MNYGVLLRRAFDITRRYRVLWLFGILVALTAAGSSPNTNWTVDGSDFQTGNLPQWLPAQEWGRQAQQLFQAINPGQIVGVLIACCCLLLILGIVALIEHYVARAALVRGVNQIEAAGVAPTWREGFRLGWSNRTFRLWLLELILGILFVLSALAVLALAASPLLLLLANSDAARVIGIVLTVLLGLPVILLLIAAAVVLSVLGQFWTREILLRDRGIGDALAGGYALVRERVKDVGIFWLLMAGIQIGFSFLMIPVFFVLLAIALLVGGALGWAVYGLAHSIVGAIAVGLPVFLLVLGIPLTFVGGLFEVYKSSAWTLAYREVAPEAAA